MSQPPLAHPVCAIWGVPVFDKAQTSCDQQTSNNQCLCWHKRKGKPPGNLGAGTPPREPTIPDSPEYIGLTQKFFWWEFIVPANVVSQVMTAKYIEFIQIFAVIEIYRDLGHKYGKQILFSA